MIAKQSIGKSFQGALAYNLKKMDQEKPEAKAELLATNFSSMKLEEMKKELAVMKAMNPRLTRNTWHTSLNFAIGEHLTNAKMKAIAEEYMTRMGFDNNLYCIFRHHDAGHPHCHILALRNRFDGTVVSDSQNYRQSETIVRELEQKYQLQVARNSRRSANKAPDKDELEMMQRTGKTSHKLILQEKVSEALKQSRTLDQFIRQLEKQGVHVLFNQASTGRVSGISYHMPGFRIRGQALGNHYKWGSIIKQIDYEQSRDGQAIRQANRRTTAQYGQKNGDGSERNHQQSQSTKGGVDQDYGRSAKPGSIPRFQNAGIGGANSPAKQTANEHGFDLQRAKDASEDLDHHLSGLRHSGSSGGNHVNPAAFILPVSDEDEATDRKRKWKNRDERRKIGRGI